ncbi:porin [Vibrio hangzhouensis]|uniref:porin n=1 Tax=Vibrio hangzhouensis TaxID=462991 RepID=UPI001C93CE06|nr:porin [Vibrio hangzhouensis]MBY6198323.1 porin [Vibrio hangzhouensis]
MNKTLLALAVTAAAIGTQANAVEIYNKEGTTAKIGGHATVAFQSNEQGSKSGQIVQNEKSPRVNLEVTTELGNGVTADVKGEWAINMENGGGNTFTTRLGYIGLTHEKAGRVALGTQWSQYYMAAGVVDQPIAWSNGFLYNNHGALGTARADRLASYSNSLDFGDAGTLNFGLGWQGASEFTSNVVSDDKTATGVKYDASNRAQGSLGYSIAGFNVNYAYVGGDVKETTGTTATKKAQSHLVSAKYGNFGSGLYVAATYADNENMNGGLVGEGLVAETKAFDSLVAYGLDNGLNLIVKHEEMKDEVKGLRMNSATSLQAEYTITPRFRAFTGYKFDNQGEGVYKEAKARNNEFLIGGRFYL